MKKHSSYFLYILLLLLLLACSAPQTPGEREQMVMKFMLRSGDLSVDRATALLDSMLSLQRDSASYRATMQQLELPLSSPASRFRQDELFKHLLHAKLNSLYYLKEEKAGFQTKLDLISQNNVGDQANNFIYRLPTGELRMMHDINTDYTLLFFYNPECPACKQMKAALYTDPVVNGNIQLGKLTVLAMYTDSDTTLWKKHLPEMPAQWIQGRDSNEHLYRDGVYDLRAIPSVYLLNKLKTVLIKDCSNEMEIAEKLK